MRVTRGGMPATRCISIPSDNGRGSFTLEEIKGDRVALRVAHLSMFFSQEEARRVLTALARMLGTDVQPTVKR